MNAVALHVTNGDGAAESLGHSGVPGDVLAWRDLLYDGPRAPGWPGEDTLHARARFLEQTTGGGLGRASILADLTRRYRLLEAAAIFRPFVLWFDACLFDQAVLAHVLTCLRHLAARQVEMLSIGAFPGVEPFHGLGQLRPEQLASLYGDRRPVTGAQFRFAERVDRAFATQDLDLFAELAEMQGAPLPHVPAAARRWLQEQPDPATGLGRLESLALAAISDGQDTPAAVFRAVAAADEPPQYWGDTTLWAKINGLAERDPPLVRVEGPADRLPLWPGEAALEELRIRPEPVE